MASSNVQTFRGTHQAFNRRDFDTVVSSLAAEFTYQDRARGITFTGPEAFREFMQGWVTAFSNAEVAEPQYIDGGDTVVALFTGRGVNDGPLGPLPKTGKRMTVPFCEVLRFNDRGQVVWGAIYYDQLSMLTQLGHTQSGAAV